MNYQRLKWFRLQKVTTRQVNLLPLLHTVIDSGVASIYWAQPLIELSCCYRNNLSFLGRVRTPAFPGFLNLMAVETTHVFFALFLTLRGSRETHTVREKSQDIVVGAKLPSQYLDGLKKREAFRDRHMKLGFFI